MLWACLLPVFAMFLQRVTSLVVVVARILLVPCIKMSGAEPMWPQAANTAHLVCIDSTVSEQDIRAKSGVHAL